MSIHPAVLAACPVLQCERFTTFEKFAQSMVRVTEAWLIADRYAVQFVYASPGPGQPILGSYLDSMGEVPEIVAHFAPVVRERMLTAVAFLTMARARLPGEKRRNTIRSINTFITTVVCPLEVRNFVWDIKIKDNSGTVESARRAPDEIGVNLTFTPEAIFGEDICRAHRESASARN